MKKFVWVIFSLLSLLLTFLLFKYLNFVYRPQPVYLKGYNNELIPFGIKKISDIEQGARSTSFSLSGIITKKPYLKDEYYFITVSIYSKKIIIKLGKASDLIGVNIAKQGNFAKFYGVQKVQLISTLIQPNSQILINITTNFNTDAPEPCDDQCKRSIYELSNFGKTVEEKLDNPNLIKDGEMLPITASQIVVITL